MDVILGLLDIDGSHLNFANIHVKGKGPREIFYQDKSRGMVVVIQAYIIKRLFFNQNNKADQDREPITSAMEVKPTELEKRNAIISGMADMLWRAGDRCGAVVMIQHGVKVGVARSEKSRLEHLVNTLRILDCDSYDKLWNQLKKHVDQFTNHEGGGMLLLLYSLILSRSISKVEVDLQGDKLLTSTDQCSLTLISLMLTGSATPYLFNGTLVYDVKGEALPEPLIGIKQRSEVGLLLVERNRVLPKDKKQVGSMLKTPLFPVWIAYLNGRYSILFCLNGNLNRDWRIEHCFVLQYFNGQPDQIKETKLTVDSRGNSLDEDKPTKYHTEERTVPLVEECILTRWPGAKVTWNGSLPFV